QRAHVHQRRGVIFDGVDLEAVGEDQHLRLLDGEIERLRLDGLGLDLQLRRQREVAGAALIGGERDRQQQGDHRAPLPASRACCTLVRSGPSPRPSPRVGRGGSVSKAFLRSTVTEFSRRKYVAAAAFTSSAVRLATTFGWLST